MSKNKKNQGVLYIRYDKNTLAGMLIEKLKERFGKNYQLSQQIVNLIFLSEVVETFDINDINPEDLNQFFYQSLNLFSTKVELSKYRIARLTNQIVTQKNQEEEIYRVRQKNEYN